MTEARPGGTTAAPRRTWRASSTGPTSACDRHDADRNLPFLLQVDLAEVRRFDLEGLLPADGMLYLFSDTRPDETEDGRG